jgi:hypothetical protein
MVSVYLEWLYNWKWVHLTKAGNNHNRRDPTLHYTTLHYTTLHYNTIQATNPQPGQLSGKEKSRRPHVPGVAEETRNLDQKEKKNEKKGQRNCPEQQFKLLQFNIHNLLATGNCRILGGCS